MTKYSMTKEEVILAYQNGESGLSISARSGLPPARVYRYLAETPKARPYGRVTTHLVAAVKDLVDKNYSSQKIAAELGTTSARVRYIIRKYLTTHVDIESSDNSGAATIVVSSNSVVTNGD